MLNLTIDGLIDLLFTNQTNKIDLNIDLDNFEQLFFFCINLLTKCAARLLGGNSFSLDDLNEDHFNILKQKFDLIGVKINKSSSENSFKIRPYVYYIKNDQLENLQKYIMKIVLKDYIHDI